MSERVEKALEIYSTNSNCAQATLAAFLDLTELDRETAFKITAPMSRGIGGRRGICGALVGVIMAAGAVKGYDHDPHPYEKTEHLNFIAEIAKKFEERFGSSNCGILLEKNEADGLVNNPCSRYVQGAVEILEELFLED